MEKVITFFSALILTVSVYAQSPEKMSYQAVIRNSSGALVTTTQIGMEINIRQGSPTGTIVYTETQTPTTNVNGLVSIEIGGGTGFNTIDWANGPYFIETNTAVVQPLTTYTITGTSQLLSVPYALHAKTAETVTGGMTETDPVFTAWDRTTGISITENQISDLGNYIKTETDPRVPVGTQTGEMQFWDGSAWVTVEPGISGQILMFINGRPKWGTIGIDTDVHNPTTGKTWMNRNLGASQVATSHTDANAYGNLYQWGRSGDGHEGRTSGTMTTLSSSNTPGHGNFITTGGSPNDWRSPQNDNLWQGVSGINNPCPSGYRLPTEAEWEAERVTWSFNNSAGAFASMLKLPSAGERDSNTGSLMVVGTYGKYWSSTVSSIYSRYLVFWSTNANMAHYHRANGFSVRCIKD
jgi:uncharacterized protein (TIGR02145 family)